MPMVAYMPGHDVNDRHADLLRAAACFVVALARHAHQATHRLYHEVVSRVVRLRAVLAEPGDRAIDQIRFDGFQVVVGEAVALQRTGLEVLEHDVALRGERAHGFLPFGRGQVDCDRALAAIH